MKLYEIAQALREHAGSYDDYINDETGEVDETGWVQRFDELELETKEKIEAIGVLLREWRGDADTLKSEIDRLKARRASLEARSETLTEYVSGTMRSLGIEKHASPHGLFTVYLQKNPDMLLVERPGALPTVFQKVTVEARKTDIKRAMEAGDLTDEIIGLAGIEIVPGARRVRYK